MRPGETAGPDTPADHRRRRQRSVLVFGFFLVAVLSALTATILFVNNGRNYRRLARQWGLEHYLLPAPPAPKLRMDHQRHLSPASSYPPWLLTHNLERSA